MSTVGLVLLKLLYYWPPLLCFLGLGGGLRQVVKADFMRWIAEKDSVGPGLGEWSQFVFVFSSYPEYRNLFRHRLRSKGSYIARCVERVFRLLYYGEKTLYIKTSEIGAGLRIQHGFATIIDAVSIGENCWINQQVTVGYTNKTDCPIIGNNVRISAGAKVLGKIIIGDNVVIGANAVVIKDVPSHCTVVGVPARIVRCKGERVDRPL